MRKIDGLESCGNKVVLINFSFQVVKLDQIFLFIANDSDIVNIKYLSKTRRTTFTRMANITSHNIR